MNSSKILFDLNDREAQLLLEILGQHHAVLYFQDKDKTQVESLIRKVADSLGAAGKTDIFFKVFQEHKCE